MPKSKTKDIDMGFHSIMEDMKTLSKTDVEVGYFDNGTWSEDGEIPMVELAELQHNGTPEGHGIPSRPFMDECANNYADDISNVQAKIVGKVIDKKLFALQGLKEIGEEYEVMMKQSIEDLKTPENAKYTIKMKGSSNPLIDSGKMQESVTSQLSEYEADAITI